MRKKSMSNFRICFAAAAAANTLMEQREFSPLVILLGLVADANFEGRPLAGGFMTLVRRPWPTNDANS